MSCIVWRHSSDVVERNPSTIGEIESRPRAPFRLFNGSLNKDPKQIDEFSPITFPSREAGELGHHPE